MKIIYFVDTANLSSYTPSVQQAGHGPAFNRQAGNLVDIELVPIAIQNALADPLDL